MPVGEYEWSHSNARGLHVHQQVADALVLGSVRVGAHQHEDPVRILRARGPHFLPVDDEEVSHVSSTSLQAGQVGTSAGLGIALAPDVISVENAWQEVLLLLVCPPLHQS